MLSKGLDVYRHPLVRNHTSPPSSFSSLFLPGKQWTVVPWESGTVIFILEYTGCWICFSSLVSKYDEEEKSRVMISMKPLMTPVNGGKVTFLSSSAITPAAVEEG